MRAFSLLAAALAGQAIAVPLEAESLAKRDLPSINAFLAEVGAIFPVNFALTTGCAFLSAGEEAVGAFFGIPDTANDICGDVTMIFVRGTCDPGDIGVLVGPFIASSIQERLGLRTLGVKGLQYPASVDDYLNGSQANGVLLANVIKATIAQCPYTKIVLSGYSQGAMVVHNAAAVLDADPMSHVSAVVLFGDPDSQQPVANIDAARVKVYCNVGDHICVDGIIIGPAHLTYAMDADDAADFVVSHV